MISINQKIFHALLGGCFVVALLLMQTTLSAETLEIQFTGLNLTYDGSTITDTGSPDDPLGSVDFFVDEVKVLGLSSPGDSPLSIDLTIPGVSNLPVGGGTVTSADDGTLSLTLPGGDFLNLELGAFEIIYVKNSIAQFYFLLAAGDAEVLGQSLPISNTLEDIVAVSFSTNITPGTLTDDGNYITSFTASGTGEIEELVPEPGTITLLLCGLAGLALLRKRR